MVPIRLALALVCGLALAAPSLADDNPPPICPGFPCGGQSPAPHASPAPPQATWKPLAYGYTRPRIRDTNRIYYARTPDQTRPWWQHLSLHDKATLKHLNFNRYGALAIFFTPRDAFTVDMVVLVPGGLRAVVSPVPVPPPPPFPTAPPGPMPSIPPPLPPSPRYVLIAIRKGSLPSPVKLLYIGESGATR
jgi:hypothetical protein